MKMMGDVKWYNGSRGYVTIYPNGQSVPAELPFYSRAIRENAFLDSGESVRLDVNPSLENPVLSVERTNDRYIAVAMERSSSRQFRVFCKSLGREFIIRDENFTFQENKFIDKNEYVSFALNSENETKNIGKVDPSTFLARFAILPNFDDKIRVLSGVAITEPWKHKSDTSKGNFPVLTSYIRYLFVWHMANDTIEYGKDNEGRSVAAWNTGLTTPLQEEIFAFFYEPREHTGRYGRKWLLYGFLKASDRLMGFLPKKPELAKFYDNPSDLVYDLNLRLEINADHILKDNLSRFPEAFRSQHSGLSELLKAQEDKVIRRVRRNYRTAVPQYARGRIQLLLPVFLRNEVEADVALLLEKTDYAYRAVTVLTLPMAYNNARLVTRPFSDWL